MHRHKYQITEIVGSSDVSFDEAITNAIAHVHKKHGETRWFEVTEQRGQIEEGKIAYYQVTVRVGHHI